MIMRMQELFESRSADLYHGTNVAKLNRILQDNMLTAQSLIRSEDIPTEYKGQSRAVSFSRDAGIATNFARSKAGGEQGLDKFPVVLVVDQEKLHRAVGKRMQPYNDLGHTIAGTERAAGGSESEEMVFGNINNVNAIIKKIIVHVPAGAHKSYLDELAKCKVVMNDPRTIVVDFINKNLTGRQFMDMTKTPVTGTPAF
jgi:hypothetical protein